MRCDASVVVLSMLELNVTRRNDDENEMSMWYSKLSWVVGLAFWRVGVSCASLSCKSNGHRQSRVFVCEYAQTVHTKSVEVSTSSTKKPRAGEWDPLILTKNINKWPDNNGEGQQLSCASSKETRLQAVDYSFWYSCLYCRWIFVPDVLFDYYRWRCCNKSCCTTSGATCNATTTGNVWSKNDYYFYKKDWRYCNDDNRLCRLGDWMWQWSSCRGSCRLETRHSSIVDSGQSSECPLRLSYVRHRTPRCSRLWNDSTRIGLYSFEERYSSGSQRYQGRVFENSYWEKWVSKDDCENTNDDVSFDFMWQTPFLMKHTVY